MQRLLALLLFVLGACTGGAANAETNWWQADWTYRKPITLDAGPAGAALDGSPGRMAVMVRLHGGNFAFDGVAADGADIRFVGADGRTVLNHQVEQFDAALGMALIWVDVPAVGAGGPQTVWMYYGNPDVPAGGNGQLAFDPDYTLVYHFAEADVAPRDTTAYGNHAATPVPAVDAAIIGRGVQLGDAPLTIPATASLAVEAAGALTVSAWVRPDSFGAAQAIFARRENGGELLVGLDNGIPFVQIDGVRGSAEQALPAAQWTHLAITAEGGQVGLYVGGREAARIEAALPAFASADITIGADVAAGSVVPDDQAGDDAAQVATAGVFSGAIDELRISRVARPATLIHADAASQGPDARLLAFGDDEQSAGVSHFGYILQAMPVDAWIVVAVLALMLVLSWALMFAKGRYFGAMAKANAAFTAQYRQVAGTPITRLHEMAQTGAVGREIREVSSLWRLYETAITELRGRHAQNGRTWLSGASIGAIRASMDAEVIRESERMSRRMNWLSTTIEGAPYIGLFGTVIGIMLVFAVAAIAGAVDINSVAPGMAAALLCTAAGLGVAIPALFGYHWLASRSEAIVADMAVFVDEIAARLAEEYDRTAHADAAAPVTRDMPVMA